MRAALTIVVLLSSVARAGTPETPETPLRTLPYVPGLDPASMDRTVEPCVDFYRYSCGGWMKNNPIPPDESRWDVFAKLAQDNERFIWGIVAELAGGERTPDQQKIGDLFAACMDEPAVEQRSGQPIMAPLDAIAKLKSIAELPSLLARLHRTASGFFFNFGSSQDFADSSSVIGFATADGLGLPDRDYYVKTDARSAKIRRQYLAHIAAMLRLVGDAPAAAKREATAVMKIEDALARASLTRVDHRDPKKLHHPVDLAGLGALTPHFDWKAYLAGIGVSAQPRYNVTEPDYYRALDKIFAQRTIVELRAYLRWHLVHSAAHYLSKAFVDEEFAFYDKILHGAEAIEPRWKRCVQVADGLLGDAVGKEFVARAFGPALKTRAHRMTEQIERAMERDLRGLDWMSAATKQRALDKLHTVVNKIGYPDKWRDYGTVTITLDDFYGDVERATEFETRRDLAKIGRPLDRSEWEMTAATVNAGYDDQRNEMAFPAGVLQPPLFDPKMDSAPNYGDTGSTVGHELTHGFDDEGRKFDAHGNLADWWTPADAKAFEERAQCIVDQYAKYTVIDDIKINSKLTEGEDIADLGGLVLAWMAWKEEDAKAPPVVRDGLSSEQRFFVGYAQWACENVRPEELRANAVVDLHSPAIYRVNGLVANMPEFERAFSCKPGQPMAPVKRCRVW
jgi:endothelin-converting enzyme/putative endopeptidase